MTEVNGKRIIICCNAYPPNFIGGAELIAHFQAKILNEMGNKVIVFAGDSTPYGDRYSFRREDYDGLPVYRVHLIAKDYQNDCVNFFHPEVESHFQHLLEEFCPDIVHFHNIIGLSVGMIHLAKKSGAKTIQTLHDNWGFCYKNTTIDNDGNVCNDYSKCSECMAFIQDGESKNIPIRLRQDYLKMQFDDIDTYISPSQYLADAYIRAGFPKEKIKVLWNGVDVERFSKVCRNNSNEIRFTYVGYFGNHKGVDVLISALPLIDSNQRVRINLVGEGEAKGSYIEQLNNNHCINMVKFWGKVDNRNIEKVYRDTDVLVLPSIWPENQPVSITEAMACGIPVIVSNIGGSVELVEDGVTGYLFEPRNENDLAEKMDKIIQNPDTIQTFGENGYKKIQNVTFFNQVNKLLDIYNAGTTNQINVNPVIGIVGDRVNKNISLAIQKLSEDKCKYWFIKNEWFSDDQLKRADLFCIADDSNWLLPVIYALKNKIPLLVPEQNGELRKLCISASCGLYYSNYLEAAMCITYLLGKDEIVNLIGSNGYCYLNNQ
ncbi:MAG: glycosyltransferase family 4 protein [Firmicutes bacterium]|nr:glycosyltransferase family 4 protein [Bacillota bacterium]